MAAFGPEDFIIDGSKKDVVSRNKAKIERLFNVMITFENVAADENGQKQWIVVSGAKSDRRIAKVMSIVHTISRKTKVVLATDVVLTDHVGLVKYFNTIFFN